MSGPVKALVSSDRPLVRIWAFSDFEITLKSSLRLKKMRTLRWHHSMKFCRRPRG